MDADTLDLLLIQDFETFEIQKVAFNLVDSQDLRHLIERNGECTHELLQSTTSLFASFEFETFIKRVISGQPVTSQALSKLI